MAQCAEKLGAIFVYLSTDFIFDGRKPFGERYREDDDPCPLNYYGLTKWAGEQEVAKTKGKWLIIRPANIYGLHALFIESPHHTATSLMTRSSWAHNMITKIQQGEKICLPDTLYQSPVYANHLAEITLRLVKEGNTGVFHVGGGDGTSRYQFMRTLVETFGLGPECLLKGSLRELEENWQVPQGLAGVLPENVCLDVEKAERTLRVKMMSLAEGLSKMKAHWKQLT